MPDEIDNGKGAEVSFAVPDQSRASMTTSIDRFAVYGDMKFMGEASASPTIIFDKTEVVKTDGGWQYQGTQYWFPNHEHSFVAVHPISVLGDAQYSDSKLSFTYTLPSDYKEAADILTATHRRHYGDNRTNDETGKTTAGAVSLRFGHIMTLINVTASLNDNIMGDDGYLEFLKFELSGFKSRTKFEIIPASLQTNDRTDDREITITLAEGEATDKMTIVFTEPVRVANGESRRLFSDSDDAVMMIPQKIGADSGARIILTYKASNETSEKQFVLPLSGLEWESGKSYNYRFTVGNKGPLFEGTTITPWEVLNAGDFVTR